MKRKTFQVIHSQLPGDKVDFKDTGNDGVEFQNFGRTIIILKNDGDKVVKATVKRASSVAGIENPDPEVKVSKGSIVVAGPFNPAAFNIDGMVQIDFPQDVKNVGLAVVSLLSFTGGADNGTGN